MQPDSIELTMTIKTANLIVFPISVLLWWCVPLTPRRLLKRQSMTIIFTIVITLLQD